MGVPSALRDRRALIAFSGIWIGHPCLRKQQQGFMVGCPRDTVAVLVKNRGASSRSFHGQRAPRPSIAPPDGSGALAAGDSNVIFHTASCERAACFTREC